MGNRLSRIYTRTGDDGSTGLGDGTRVSKHSLRVEAYGSIDELNAQIGLFACHMHSAQFEAFLVEIQQALFDLGGELCIPGYETIRAEQISWLENWLDHFNGTLPPLQDFVLPGGSMVVAQCHMARTICRRAERRVVALSEIEAINPLGLIFLNRLSDCLFVLGRYLAREHGAQESLWRRERTLPYPPVLG